MAGAVGRRWGQKVRLVEKDMVFKSAKALAQWLEVDVSLVYRVLRDERPSVKGYHLEKVN